MKAERKTKAQLVKELDDLHRRINELEAGETKFKKSASALKESENRFRNIFESSKDGIIFFDGKTRKILLGNSAMAELLGCSKKALVGRTIPFLHPPEDWVWIEKEFQKHLSSKVHVSTGIPILRNDGSVFYADINSSLITLKGRTYFSAFFRDITERKRAEEVLIESREQYRSLASAEDSMYLVDRESRFLFMNDAHLSRLGLSLDKVAGRSYGDFHSPEDTQLFRAAVEKVFETSSSCQVEHHSERDHKYFLRTFSPMRDAQGKITAITVISKDITDHKQTQEALLESEARYRSLFENSDDAILLTAPDGRIFQANPSACRIFGRTEAEIIQMGRNGVVDETDPRLPVMLEERKRTGRVRGDLTFKRRDGQLFPGEMTSVVFRSKEGLRTCMIIRDITESKQKEEALRESEEKYRNLVERANDGIGIGQDGIMRFANARLADMIGYSIEEIVGKPFMDFFMPEEVPKVVDLYRRRMDGEILPTIYETALRHKDGRKIDIEVNTGIINYKGKPADLVLSRDITRRKQVLAALREREETFRALAENANDGIFITVGKGIQAFANKRAGEITGYSKAELLKTVIQDLIHPDEVQKIMERYKKRLAGEPAPPQYETIIIRKDGKSLPIELTASKTVWHGQPADLVIIRDISERKRVEEVLLANEARLKAQYQGSPIPTFTWQKKGETFELVDLNQAAQVATPGEAKTYLGKTADEMYQVLNDGF